MSSGKIIESREVINGENVFHDVTFTGLDLSGAQLRNKEFSNCRWESCHFFETELVECNFEDCFWKSCNLSVTVLKGAGFVDCRFYGSKLLGVNWAAGTRMPFRVSFENSDLSNSSFARMRLTKIQMKRCRLREADFSHTKMPYADLSGCDLKDARFFGTDLSNANLRNAEAYCIDPTQNTLKGARFSLPEALSLLQPFQVVVD
ncbi:hypothetical protein C5Y96_24905 [Blastopirellula marina]|uniref:Pentapeptide repeat-containing protein n=1 Tax=Blastopirellula marina TaxID=124 RepID=A0A2S8F083_9BACT|nr:MULTISPECIES: pentapeptide repeat-containing protein [Pirellulaceae]PQO25575.1 hypothetical protein C5Y96_24905 [Blastopirellula marina]RCS42539.1 pentapeptide repeat-containing protein [Bremerella cremea]